MAKNRELFEKKQELKKEWEDCFGKAIESRFSSIGLAKFWSDETSAKEAEAMLTCAAINDFLGELVEHIEGIAVIHIGSDDEEEPCNIKNGTPYKIARVEDGKLVHIEDDEFETEEAAKAKIQERVNHSTHTLDDFCVIQVQVCK